MRLASSDRLIRGKPSGAPSNADRAQLVWRRRCERSRCRCAAATGRARPRSRAAGRRARAGTCSAPAASDRPPGHPQDRPCRRSACRPSSPRALLATIPLAARPGRRRPERHPAGADALAGNRRRRMPARALAGGDGHARRSPRRRSAAWLVPAARSAQGPRATSRCRATSRRRTTTAAAIRPGAPLRGTLCRRAAAAWQNDPAALPRRLQALLDRTRSWLTVAAAAPRMGRRRRSRRFRVRIRFPARTVRPLAAPPPLTPPRTPPRQSSLPRSQRSSLPARSGHAPQIHAVRLDPFRPSDHTMTNNHADAASRANPLRDLGQSYFPAWQTSALAEVNIGQFAGEAMNRILGLRKVPTDRARLPHHRLHHPLALEVLERAAGGELPRSPHPRLPRRAGLRDRPPGRRRWPPPRSRAAAHDVGRAC